MNEEAESFSWRVRLADKAPQKVVAIFVVATLTLLTGSIGFRSVLLGASGFAMILGSTAEFWLGTRYRIDASGVQSTTGFSTTAIEWGNIKRIVHVPGGLLLSPLERESRFDAFRGVNLRFSEDNQESVIGALIKLGGLSGAICEWADRRGNGEAGG